MANKHNDWLATLYYNPSMDLSDMKMLDITPENTEFKTKAEYKNMPAIIDAFKNERGEFNEKKFDALYDMASQLYNTFENNQYIEKLPKLLGYLDTQWDATLDANFINTSPRIETHKNENDFSFGLSEVGHLGKSLYANKTPLEIAESQKVVDPITGEELDWTPEDKGGVLKGLTRPTIVLATWDEDGSEIIDGIEVFHKKGDLKYNQNGKPYTELLGDRNPSNKTVVAWTDTFTRESSQWNKYDFFDSDDLEKSFIGVVAKTAFTIAPYFIPYLNYAWAAITASEALGRVIPVIGKAVNGIWTGDPNNDFAKKMNIMQGALMRFDPTVTQKSKENLLTFENLGNLVGMIGGQLIQQQAVASLPMLLNGMKATEKTAKWGQRLALDYMALTSAQDSYDTFKEAGASDRTAGWAFIANTLALRGLMGIDYFRDNVFKHTYMDESTVRVPLFNASKKIAPELIEEAEKVTTAEEANKVISKLQKFYHDNLLNGVKRNDIFARMLSEGTEEVMEEVTLDLTKLGAKLTESFGGNLTEGMEPLDFKTDLKDIVQRYGMSFFGGMLGGAMFAGQQKYWNWLGGVDTSSIDNDDFKKLVYYIGEGKADEMRGWLETWHKKGLLGSKNLTSKMSTITSLDGVTPVMEQVSSSNKISQNDAVYNGMLNFIDTMENIIKSEGIYITPENIVRVKKMGFNVTDKTLNADVLANSTEYSHFMDDYLQLAKDIVTANLELKEAILNATVKEDTPEARKKTEDNIHNSVEIAKLQERLRELRTRRDDFLSGKYNWKYALEGLFVLNDQINTKFGNINLDSFARLYGKDISSVSPEERELITKEFEDFQKKEGKYNVSQSAEVYRQFAAYLAPIFEKLTQELKDYNPDDKHKLGNYGQTTYVELLDKYKDTENKLNELRQKEDLTEEDKEQINILTKDLADTISHLKAISTNPGSMLISAQNGELIKLGDILQNPNLSSEDWTNIYNGLVSLYNNYASSNTVLSGDTELEGMYNRIRKDFNSVPIMQRIISYMSWKYNSMPDDGEDPNLKESVVNLSESTSKNGNTWFAYYADENTAFQRHIGDLISQFVNAIGVNNTAANKVYNQILQEFKDNTNVSDADVQEMLNFILPNIAGKNLYDLMLEFDNLRKNVKYAPLTDILNKFFFNYSGRSTSLLDMIAAEERRFADGENALDYLIYDNQNLEDLKTMKSLLDVVGAVIIGASNKINSSINNFEGNPEILAVLDDHTSKILGQQFDTLLQRINYLLSCAEDNRNRQLRMHEDIDKNMRSKFLKAMISPAFSTLFSATFSYTDANGESHSINPSEIWKEAAPTDLVWDTITMIDEAKLRAAENAFAQKMHDEMIKLPYYDNNETLAKKLVSVFGKNLSFMQTTILGKDGTEIVSQYALLNYMLSMLGMESTIFNTKYKNTIAQDSFDFAPVYGQELAVKTASAFLARPELFNAVIDAMMLPENVELPDSMNSVLKKHIESRTKLYNFFIVPGSSGSGKSTGVIGTLSAMLKDHPSHQWITLSKSKAIAQNLANNIVDEDIEVYDWEHFREDVFGREFGRYKENEENGHFELENPITSSKKSLFDAGKDLKILAVDEISLFTEAELDALSKWAKSRGILIIGLGDPLQNSAKVTFERVLSNGTTRVESQNSGLEDTVFMSSPTLTASLRVLNLAQKTNFENLYNRLYATYVESTKYGAWDIGNYDNSLNTEDLIIEFYESPSVIFGTKIVDDIDLIAEARKKKAGHSVAIIYDETTETKYKNLDEDGIILVPYNDMQGREFDYVFVDVDWKKHSRLSATYVSKYNVMRDFYTVTQRAKIGGIVIDNNIKELLSIQQDTSNSDMNQIFEIDKNQKSKFKEARVEAMSGLPEKEGFNESIPGIKIAKKLVEKPAQTQSINPKNSVKPPITPAETPQIIPPSSGLGTPPVEPLPSAPKKAIPAQPIQEVTPTSTVGDNGIFYRWLYNVDGFTSFETSNDHSLQNVVKKFNPNYKFQSENYRDIVNFIASCIRNNGNVISSINGILRPLTLSGQDIIVEGLKPYFKNAPEIRVNPLNNGQSIVSARFYNGEDYIIIPLMIVDGTKSGIYTGKISRVRKAEKGERGKHISNAQLKSSNYDIWLSNAAILAMSEEKRKQIETSPDYSESTKNLLLDRGNIGKVGVVFTDEPFIAENRFNGYLFTDDNGFILKDYDDVALMFTQKLSTLTDLVSFAKGMAYIKNPDRLRSSDKVMYTREPMYVPAEEIVTKLLGLDVKSIPEKGSGRFKTISDHFQILDRKSLPQFFKSVLTLANTKSKYMSIYDSLFDFMRTNKPVNERSDYNILEQNAIWAKVDDKSYIFEMAQKDNKTVLKVFSYNVDENSVILIDVLDKLPHIRNLFEMYFNERVPEMELVYHLYSYNKDATFKEDKIKTNVDPNDQIYYAFKGVTIDPEDNETFNNLEIDGRVPYKNGIYLNVNATAAFGEDSVWMSADVNVQTLMTDIQNIVYSQYAIDDNNIVPFDEETKVSEFDKFTTDLYNFLRQNGILEFTEEELKNIGSSDDIFIQLNRQFEKDAFEKKFSPVKMVLGLDENGMFILTRTTDYKGFIESCDKNENNVIPINTFTFDSYNFIVYQTENKEYKILRKENGTWEAIPFKSYESFSNLIGLFDEANEFTQKILPLKDYVYSILNPYNAALNAVAERATEYMYNNIADPEIAAIYEQINNYLLERLENNEC